VQQATLRKVYPATIEVKLSEREPFAVWQNEGQLTVIEKTGAPIAPFAGTRHAGLPLVVGKGAADLAAGFVGLVARQPELAARVTGYVRVGERRWDLQIDDRITVRLPEGDEAAAIAELVNLDRRSGLLAADIVEVDLRLSDRLFVKLSPDAATARVDAIKARIKAASGRRQT
jgi:cell division protein FtsQ